MKDSIQKIRRFYEKKRRMPSFSEIAELVGYKSKNAVSKLVDKLIERELLAKDDRSSSWIHKENGKDAGGRDRCCGEKIV